MPNSQNWITRRRVVLFTCLALLIGLMGWLWIRPSSSLQREVEAVGGDYSERNMDIPSRMSMRSLLRLVDAVANKALGKDRRSISIVFYKADVTDDWVRRNAEELKKLPIRYLNFRRTGITDRAITDLAGMKSVTQLDLAGTSITDQSMSAIRRMRNLQYVDLTDTHVTGDGISQLGAHQLLKHIDISGDVLTDEAVIQINAMARLRSLGLKDFDNNQLSRLSGLKKVNVLSLTAATDESLPLIPQLNQLDYLILYDSELSPDSVETIRRTLPNLNVHQGMSFEAGEASGVFENLAIQQRVMRIAFFVIILSVASLVLFVGLIWRRRSARRLRDAMQEESVQ